MEIAKEEVFLSQWGNSKALRLPATLISFLGFEVQDKLSLDVEVNQETGEKKLIVKKIEMVPRTIEELFKDYKGESFQAEIQDFETLGNELW